MVRPLLSPVQMYLASLDDGSRPTVRGRLDRIAALLSPGSDASTYNWPAMTVNEVMQVKATLAQSYSWVTVNSYIAAVKGCLRMAWQCGAMTTDAYQRTVAVKSFRGTVIPAGRHVEQAEFSALFNALAQDQSVKGKRDLALLSLVRATGCRREEATNLDLADLSLKALTVRIDGKGRKERESVITSWTRGPLQAWIAVRGTVEGPLFAAVRHNGKVSRPLKRLTNPGMDGILRRRIAEFQLPSFGWHDVRRSAATDLFDQGADLKVVMVQLGHSNPKSSLRYDRRETRKLQDRARTIANPFGGE